MYKDMLGCFNECKRLIDKCNHYEIILRSNIRENHHVFFKNRLMSKIMFVKDLCNRNVKFKTLQTECFNMKFYYFKTTN